MTKIDVNPYSMTGEKLRPNFIELPEDWRYREHLHFDLLEQDCAVLISDAEDKKLLPRSKDKQRNQQGILTGDSGLDFNPWKHENT